MKAVRYLRLLILLLLVWGVTACERPAPDGSGDVDELVATAVVDQPTVDANSGGGVPGDATQEPVAGETTVTSDATAPPQPVNTATPESDTPRLTEEATPTPEPTSETTVEMTEDEKESETAVTTTTEKDKTETTDSDETTDPVEASDTANTTPTTHTVAVGENLYRIGLQYGISWLRLAEYNNLNNPNQIIVGQQINIPGTGETASNANDESSESMEPQPTPSPLTETTYKVQLGDNLYQISLAYGISWVQIAEANGIVNPNQIVVGQELKIPVDTPGPTPQFTHQVKANETLFLISLQYGLSWTAIADANDITSPFVIYEGQSLVIPGG